MNAVPSTPPAGKRKHDAKTTCALRQVALCANNAPEAGGLGRETAPAVPETAAGSFHGQMPDMCQEDTANWRPHSPGRERCCSAQMPRVARARCLPASGRDALPCQSENCEGRAQKVHAVQVRVRPGQATRFPHELGESRRRELTFPPRSGQFTDCGQAEGIQESSVWYGDASFRPHPTMFIDARSSHSGGASTGTPRFGRPHASCIRAHVAVGHVHRPTLRIVGAKSNGGADGWLGDGIGSRQ